MFYRRSRIRLLPCIFGILFLVACGKSNNNYPVRGMVTIQGNGPLTRGSIFFSSDKFTGQGDLQPDGTFELGTIGQSDGVPAGEYKVFFAGTSTGDYTHPELAIASRYSTLESTDLNATVMESNEGNMINFELDPPQD